MEVSDASNPWVTKLVVKVWMHCSHRSAVSHCFHNTKRNACSTKNRDDFWNTGESFFWNIGSPVSGDLLAFFEKVGE